MNSQPSKSHGGDWILERDHICKLDKIISADNLQYTVVDKARLSDTVVRMVLHAPLVALNALPGQFCLVRPHEHAERIPLTISHANRERGEVTIIFQEVGATTRALGQLDEGSFVRDLVGPLGTPSKIENYGTVVCIGGGVGIAVMLPVTQALQAAGNHVTGIIGARAKTLLILEDEMRRACEQLVIVTDDGSYGAKGLVTDALTNVTLATSIDLIYAIGPMPMMHAVCNTSYEMGIKTIVSLDPVMVDGTGMCGGCRVNIGGEAKFTCVDGPEFDGHLVDWDTLRARKSIFRQEEQAAVIQWESQDAQA